MARPPSQAVCDARLAAILATHQAVRCPDCGHALGWGDVAWNSASTEPGTDYSIIFIHCAACDTEILHLESWFPYIRSAADVLEILESDWGEENHRCI